MGSKPRRLIQWFVVITACAYLGVASGTSPSTDTPEPRGPVVNPESEVRELGDGARLVLAPGAIVTDAGTLRLPVSLGAGGTIPAAAFVLESGRVDVVIAGPGAGRRAIVVRGPRQTALIGRFGHATMVVEESQIAVAAYDGVVAIAAPARWVTLRAGERWVADTPVPDGLKAPLIAAPVVTLRTPLHIAAPGAVGQVRVVVKPVNEAAAYAVAAVPKPGSNQRPRLFISTMSDVMVRGLGPGTYELEARAVDSFGLEGLPASPVPLRVVGVKLPPGAYSRNGTPVLADGQLLELTHAEGLELSYDKADYFIPVPPAVGLRRGHPVLVRLREPGSEAEAQLLIEPRHFESSIVMTPPNPIWPRDTVHIAVDMSELAQGGEDWPTLSVLLRTTLNDALLAPEWKCRETGCRTDIRPPSTPGPWVLRVEMVDDQGTLVGRNFLEIAGERGP